MTNLKAELWQQERKCRTIENTIKGLELEKEEYEKMKTQLKDIETKLNSGKSKIENAKNELIASFSGVSIKKHIKEIDEIVKNIKTKTNIIAEALSDADADIAKINNKIAAEKDILLMTRRNINDINLKIKKELL